MNFRLLFGFFLDFVSMVSICAAGFTLPLPSSLPWLRSGLFVLEWHWGRLLLLRVVVMVLVAVIADGCHLSISHSPITVPHCILVEFVIFGTYGW